jgi:hypothetical protein
MNDRDQSQREAIRTLAKLSATHESAQSARRVDPIEESEERERLSRLLDPNHIKAVKGPESNNATLTENFITLLKFAIIAPIVGYGLYAIVVAFLSA